MPPLPALTFASGPATGGMVGGGNGWTQGTWNVNLGGSGTAYQSASGGMSPLLLVGLAVLALLAFEGKL